MSKATLAFLQPKRKMRIMDIVRETGIDVSDWANYAKGPTQAAANPKYCYEWAFSGDDHVVLCFWFESLKSETDGIVIRTNLRKDVEQHRGNSHWVSRARKMDRAIQRAWHKELPVRVVLLDGRPSQGVSASRVEARVLDAAAWYVARYGEADGSCLLKRGNPGPASFDQHGPVLGSEKPRRVETLSKSYVRDLQVRRAALLRAQGICEYCGKPGFQTSTGGRFLETHHIIPLGEGGLDTIGNVAAICPNHHREAHHGENAARIRQHLQALLGKK